MDLKKFLKTVKLSEQTVSTILGALVIIVIGIFIFNYFQKNQTQVTNKAAQTTDNSVKLIEENGEMVPQGLPTTHKVEKGENLWTISEKYYGSGYNWVDVAKENKLSNANKLLVGQELSIPKTAVKQVVTAKVENPITSSSYTVVKGDHLWKIAVRAYGDGFQWTKVAEANNLKNPNIIVPGQVLTLPR